MKILFIRHGESVDDIENRYGGWSDFDLTDKGGKQITKSSKLIKKLGVKFDLILTSPLKRASQSAKILSKELKISVETLEYVKERNTYGLLSGMVKGDAKKKYPIQVENLGNDKYVDGSERYKDLTARVKKSVDLIKQSGKDSVIVVTHGNYLKCVFNEIIGKVLTKKEDGGFVLTELEGNNLILLKAVGIEYE